MKLSNTILTTLLLSGAVANAQSCGPDLVDTTANKSVNEMDGSHLNVRNPDLNIRVTKTVIGPAGELIEEIEVVPIINPRICAGCGRG